VSLVVVGVEGLCPMYSLHLTKIVKVQLVLRVSFASFQHVVQDIGVDTDFATLDQSVSGSIIVYRYKTYSVC
jgi:hypothetical protein